MKKLKNELFIKFTAITIAAFVIFFILLALFFNYRYKTVVLNKIKERIPLFKEYILDNFNTGRLRNFRRLPEHQHPLFKDRFKYIGIVIFNNRGKVVFTRPRFFKEKKFIKLNEKKVISDNEKYSMNIYIHKSRIFNKKDREFINLMFIYSISILGILIIIYFYISRKISRKIVKFFSTIKDQILKIGNGNYSFEMEQEYEEYIPIEKGLKDLSNLLENEEKRRKNFLNNVSHDIKTPLTILKGLIEGMKDGVIKKEKKNFRSIYEELIYIEEILEKIKLLDSDLREENKKEWINLKKIFIEYKKKYSGLMNIFVNLEEERKILFNRKKFKTILDNIFSNSYKHNLKEKKICRVKVDKEDSFFIIKFKDNGMGIEKKDIPYIFERFYKGDNSRRNRDSSGLGLTIVKEIVNEYNGVLKIQSEVKKYTEVTIKFPVKN
ncbi:MAG TPA: HAMP domain-containing sensor histidine kinase [Candidatus Mcinerneyibacterium sp.]|nr:HAMP domain-containing sensor histidine kinase [Candidatus Mcinerneyibacterium sp.]